MGTLRAVCLSVSSPTVGRSTTGAEKFKPSPYPNLPPPSPIGAATLHLISTLLPDLDGEIYLTTRSFADVNSDGKVNILDLVQVANGLGKSAPDPNGDGASQYLWIWCLSPSSSINKITLFYLFIPEI